MQSGLETDPSWVEIVPLDYDSDRNVALDFLKENGVDNAEVLISLDSDRWYVDFTKALSAYSLGWPRNGSVTDLITSSALSKNGVGKIGSTQCLFLWNPAQTIIPHSAANRLRT